MSLNYLCVKKREWIYQNQQQVMPLLIEIQFQGEYLFTNKRWRQAIPYLGSAYDSACILLELQGLTCSKLLTRFCDLALSLIKCYHQLKQINKANVIADSTLIKMDVAICLLTAINHPDSAVLNKYRQQLLIYVDQPMSFCNRENCQYGLH